MANRHSATETAKQDKDFKLDASAPEWQLASAAVSDSTSLTCLPTHSLPLPQTLLSEFGVSCDHPDSKPVSLIGPDVQYLDDLAERALKPSNWHRHGE
jgi:hypothetical protein